MLKIFLFIAFFCLSDIVRSQTVCDCEDVWVVPVDIYKLAEADILYSQVSSTATQRLLIDNVCYSQELNDDGVLNVGMSITYQNGSVVTANVEQSQIEPGIFLISGGADYIDYIIGEPCDSVYVIYRCFYKRRPCPTDVDGIIVIIESARQYVPEHCIEWGIEITERQFPGIRFYDLPRQLDTFCEN